MHTDQLLLGQGREQIHVALDQRVLGDQRERMPGFLHHLDQLAGYAQLAFDWLIRISVDAQGNRLRHIAGLGQLAPQHVGSIGLGEDLGFEIQPRRQVQIGMRRPRETVGAPTLYVFEEMCSLRCPRMLNS